MGLHPISVSTTFVRPRASHKRWDQSGQSDANGCSRSGLRIPDSRRSGDGTITCTLERLLTSDHGNESSRAHV